ncbi:uncharacterized protein EV420DRAFT_1766253 [Desarmillaria tabescens]|uniref:Uncharacterized protein n=1 Tax=Armillaria tabescens TaxID=1929756 RepID=A0AA39K2I8_ARMTA|nr:uncharacterized protein EV420DRAFT_1766253 [Desarmillaria tabescens]KAK0452186.1 hypothetical protein EV420DRAFT_1766253 [Desarmillaria tabescens]
MPTDPYFVWNVTSWSMGAHDHDPRNKHPMFHTKLIVYPGYKHGLDSSHASLVYYPFDSYQSQIIAFAQDATTNKSVPLVLNSATALFPTSSSGFKIKTDNLSEKPDYLKDMKPGHRVINVLVTIECSALVIVYCLVITFTFWLVTLMSSLIMIATVVFGFRQRNEIVVIPAGTVFAFTQLRSSMPGATEGLGDILDFAGILPCLILLSISAVTMVGIYLFADPDHPSRRSFTWSELENALHHYIQPIWITAQEWVRRARFRIMTAGRILRAPHNVEILLTDIAHENQA